MNTNVEMGKSPALDTLLHQLLAEEGLPASFRATVDRVYRPLAEELAARVANTPGPLVVGICGAQGSGKSTLAKFVAAILDAEQGLPCAAFSLDDLYLTGAERRQLAADVHPLLAVRGVPGTHDIELGLDVLKDLAQAGNHDFTAIPAFDKAVDDRRPQAAWPVFRGRPRVILVEGWCVGARPQQEAELAQPINAVEQQRDRDGRWRHYVNAQLAGRYQQLFARLEMLILIRVPRWELVRDWRLVQEEKLRARLRAQGGDASALMSPEQVGTFVQYYERITRHILAEMPARADCLLTLDENHDIAAVVGLAARSGPA